MVVPEVGLEAEVAGDLVVVSVVEWELAIVLAEGLVVVVGSVCASARGSSCCLDGKSSAAQDRCACALSFSFSFLLKDDDGVTH